MIKPRFDTTSADNGNSPNYPTTMHLACTAGKLLCASKRTSLSGNTLGAETFSLGVFYVRNASATSSRRHHALPSRCSMYSRINRRTPWKGIWFSRMQSCSKTALFHGPIRMVSRAVRSHAFVGESPYTACCLHNVAHNTGQAVRQRNATILGRIHEQVRYSG